MLVGHLEALSLLWTHGASKPHRPQQGHAAKRGHRRYRGVVVKEWGADMTGQNLC